MLHHSTGQRLKRSTKLTNKKTALEVALALEHGEHLARKGAFSESRLRELLEQTLERVIGAPVQHHTTRTWFDEWWDEENKIAHVQLPLNVTPRLHAIFFLHLVHVPNCRWNTSRPKIFASIGTPRPKKV